MQTMMTRIYYSNKVKIVIDRSLIIEFIIREISFVRFRFTPVHCAVTYIFHHTRRIMQTMRIPSFLHLVLLSLRTYETTVNRTTTPYTCIIMSNITAPRRIALTSYLLPLRKLIVPANDNNICTYSGVYLLRVSFIVMIPWSL